jgi:hypothetical protein
MPIVYALVARGKTVLAEFTNTSGKEEQGDRVNEKARYKPYVKRPIRLTLRVLVTLEALFL